MAKIACDVDSTLYNFEWAARDAFFRMAHDDDNKDLFKGAYFPWVEWRSPDDACGSDHWQRAIDLAHDPSVILDQQPYPGAAQTLQSLVENGHSIMYITNRKENIKETTERWLKSHDFPFGDYCFLVCTTKKKTPFLYDCQYLIDDRPRTLIDFVYSYTWQNEYPTKPRKAFSLLHEYNRALTDVRGIYLAPTWGGLNHYFVEKDLLSKPAYTALGMSYA